MPKKLSTETHPLDCSPDIISSALSSTHFLTCAILSSGVDIVDSERPIPFFAAESII